MRYLTLVVILLFTLTTLTGQTIPNSEFKWEKIENCLPPDACTSIYYRAEVDPVLDQYTADEFYSLMTNSLCCLKLDDTDKGVIKLKLLFLADQSICLLSVGMINLKIPKSQLQSLSNKLSAIDQITFATMKGKPVNSMAYIYFKIENGILKEMRNVNFHLKEKT